jgi:hypothetical protein
VNTFNDIRTEKAFSIRRYLVEGERVKFFFYKGSNLVNYLCYRVGTDELMVDEEGGKWVMVVAPPYVLAAEVRGSLIPVESNEGWVAFSLLKFGERFTHQASKIDGRWWLRQILSEEAPLMKEELVREAIKKKLSLVNF